MCKPFLGCVTVLLIACAVGRAADTDDKLVRDLVVQFKDPKNKPEVRSTAIRALAGLGWPSRAAVPDLIKLLDDPAERQGARQTLGPYYQTIVALGRIGPPSRDAVPSLVKAKGLAATYDHAIDTALEEILLPSPGTLSAVLAALKDFDPRIRASAARALANFSGDAAQVLAALRDTAKDPDPEVSRAAKETAEQVTQQEVFRLAQILKDRDVNGRWTWDENVRLLAAKTLQTYHADAAPALAALYDAAKDPDPDVRHVADVTAKQVTELEIQRLVKLLKDKDVNVRMLAAKALGRMGHYAAAAGPAVTETAATDPDADVRSVARNALLKIEGKP
ncbi:MAG TPA: HEAT repeat domain-containing protein [Gemmataceae bacterium]|nr:HEAT repeat domain-containing protein [Gemmataceae bacterium]